MREGWLCPQCNTVNNPDNKTCNCETITEYEPNPPTYNEILFIGGGICLIILVLGVFIILEPDTKIIKEKEFIEIPGKTREISHTIQAEIKTNELSWVEKDNYREELGLEPWDNLPDTIELGQIIYKENDN